MKLMSELIQDHLPKKEGPKLIHAIQEAFVMKYLSTPIISTEAKCPMCGGNKGMHCLIEPSLSDKRVWFCTEADCTALVRRSFLKGTPIIHKHKRSTEWPLFCEMNDLGDIDHEVTFEKVEQSSTKIEYLLKFAATPKGIILMEGETGSGKTYASTALCELFTRTNASCLFYTYARLSKEWLETFKSDRPAGLLEKLKSVNLLVIDDFGSAEPTEKFMEFFMELINARLKWSNRGTVITTNLDDIKLGKYCGEYLTNRINTGQKFQFKEKSRRKQTVL